MQDNFSLKFGLDETPNLEEEKDKVIVIGPSDSIVDTDYQNSREKINEILNIGTNAIKELSTLAKMSNDPESYAVLSNLIKNVADATKTLSGQHKDYKEIRGNSKTPADNDKTLRLNTMTLLRLLKEEETPK